MGSYLFPEFVFSRFFPQNMLFQAKVSRIDGMRGVNWDEKYPLDCLGSKMGPSHLNLA
jgi:hypothetical protein